MEKIEFRHGGPEYDAKYPDGIPTTLEIEHSRLGSLSSGLIMYPLGHARNQDPQLYDVLDFKFQSLARLAVDDPAALRLRFSNLGEKSVEEISRLCDISIRGV